MKKYLIIGGVVVLIIAFVGIAMSLGSDDTESNAPAQKASQEDSQSDSTSGSSAANKEEEEETSSEEDKNAARYINYTPEEYDEASDKQRVLVFIDTSHEASMSLDQLLKSSLKELPNDVVLFRVDLKKHSELASSLNVILPGTALKFTEDNTVAGMYILPETPDLETFRTSLKLDAKE